MEHETRAGLPVTLRNDDDGLIGVAGYAAVFNEEANIGGFFREKILPGAFSKVLRDDVVFNVEHEGLPLARSRNGVGTLRLAQDDRGLHIETDLNPEDPDVQRVVVKLKDGNLDEMSFAFRVAPGGQVWDDSQDPPLRTISEFSELIDVSVVTRGAYGGTEIGLRSLKQHQAARRGENFSAARRRLRLKRNLELKLRENG